MKVWFVGAGPGAPDLITVRGRDLIEKADVIIYAGSLVNPQLLDINSRNAEIHNSASMTLDEVVKVVEKAVSKQQMVVRLHTGDPAIYGAIREQMREFDKRDIPYEVVPGVSSFSASAAAMNMEFTLPGVSQTLILTRIKGRTPVPGKENLASLASHRASMAIFLSVHKIEEVVEELIQHYSGKTPVAVVQKASWDDQKIVKGVLEDIADKVKEAGISKTAQILVGEFLGDEFDKSLLYDGSFSHMYRSGVN